MSKSSFRWEKLRIARIVFDIAAFCVCVYQIVSGVGMINANFSAETFGRYINSSNYSSLTVGETVYGAVGNIVFQYDGSDDGQALNYYLIKSDDDKFITFRTEAESQCDKNMQKLLSGEVSEVEFRGYVQEMSDTVKSSLNFQRLADNLLDKNDIKASWSESLISLVVDITTINAQIKYEVILATFVGAVIMLLLGILLIKKPIKDAVYSIMLASGKIRENVNLESETPLEINEFYRNDESRDGGFYSDYDSEKEPDENKYDNDEKL